MALEDLVGDLGGLASLAGEASGGISGLVESLKAAGLASTDAAGRLRDLSGKFISKDALSAMASGGAEAAAGMAKLGEASKAAGGGAASGGSALTALGGDMESLLGKATNLGGPLGEVQKLLGGLGPEGQAAAAAIGVVVGAATAAIGVLTQLGEAAISVVQQRAGLLATFSALGGGAAGGAATLAMVEKLGQSLPFATAQIGEWAQGLMAAGLQGKELETAIKAVASAAAIMPATGAAAAQNLISKLAEGGAGADKMIKSLKEGGGKSNKMLAEMGLSTKDLAAAMGMTVEQFKKASIDAGTMQKAIEKALIKKGAGPLEELGATFPVLIQKVREGFMSLFSKLGPAVGPFMKAVKGLFGEFSKGGGVIKFLAPIVTSVMTTLFAWGTKAVGAIHSLVTWLLNSGKAGGMFSGVVAVAKVVWAQLVTIFGVVKAALSPVIALFRALLANAMVMKGIKTIFTVIAIVVGAVVLAIATLVGIFVVVGAAAAAFVGLVVGAFAGVVGEVAGFVGSIVDGLTSFDFSAFVAKMSGMAAAGLAAFKGVFGINSPSTVLLEHGEDDMAGAAATGVDKGAGKLKSSMKKMGDDATPKGAEGGGRGKGEGGDDGERILFKDCTFNGTDESLMRRVISKVLSELSGESGAQGATS